MVYYECVVHLRGVLSAGKHSWGDAILSGILTTTLLAAFRDHAAIKNVYDQAAVLTDMVLTTRVFAGEGERYSIIQGDYCVLLFGLVTYTVSEMYSITSSIGKLTTTRGRKNQRAILWVCLELWGAQPSYFRVLCCRLIGNTLVQRQFVSP